MRLIWQYTFIRAENPYTLNCVYMRSVSFYSPFNSSNVTETWQETEVAFIKQMTRSVDQARKQPVLALTGRKEGRSVASMKYLQTTRQG